MVSVYLKMVQDIKHYNPEDANNKQLSDDWRILCGWYATALDHKKKIKFSMDEIIQTAKKIYLEIIKRVNAGDMVHEFKPDEMTDSSRQLYDFLIKETGVSPEVFQEETKNFMEISKGNVSERGSMIEIRDVIEPLQGKEFMLMEDAVTLVGSLANYNKTDGDIDLMLKNPKDAASVIQFRLERFPPLAQLRKRMQFITDDPRGPFTNHVHLADLIVRFKNPMSMHSMSEDASDESELKKYSTASNEKKHSPEKCMDCEAPPFYEVKWAEGMAHAWFCEKHFNNWAAAHSYDIDYVKKVKDGRAADKFADNKNPNIWGDLKSSFTSKNKLIQNTFKEDAARSAATDEVVPGRAFYQQKPIHGRRIGESYNIDSLIEILNNQWGTDWKTNGVYVSRKLDGATDQVHIRENQGVVKIWTEDGSDITKNLPTIAAEFNAKKLRDTIVIGEFELWKDGKHQPRAISSAVCNHYNPELEPFMRFTIYDKFFYGPLGDIHNKTYEFRRNEYLKINETEHIKVSKEETLCRSESEVRAAVKSFSDKEGSEGAMIKDASAPYILKVHPTEPSMIKFKKERQVTGRVVGIHKIQGADAWVYSLATDDSKRLDKGMLITEPHAKWIYEGKKKAILKKKDYNIAGREFILIGDKAYGIISLASSPELINNIEEFRKTKEAHMVSEDELKTWWNIDFPLYLWRFKFFKFDEPKDYVKKPGAQAFINDLKIESLPALKKTWITKTYTSSIKANLGDLLEVSFVDVSEYIDQNSGQLWFNLWAPHVTTKHETGGTTKIEVLENYVKKTTGRVEIKPLPKEPYEYTPEGTEPKQAKNWATQNLNDRQKQEVKKWTDYVLEKKTWPETAEDGCGFAVTWAGGRAMVTYKFKEDALSFIAQGDREVAAVSYGPRKEGARIRTSFKPDPSATKNADTKNADTRKFVIQIHIRGGTAHGDFRYENNAGSLDGFTFLIQKEKEFMDKLKWTLKKDELLWDSKSYFKFSKDEVIEKPSKELEKEVFDYHKKLIEDPSLWKIDINTGEELEREEGKRQILCVKKTKEPHSWLTVEGVTLPREVEEDPGGTRYYPGIFIIIDHGTLERGASKPYYEELFLQGKKWKGRVIFREHHLDEDSATFQWLYEKTKEETPYVIDKRAVKQGWLPKGYSALPSKLEYLVPPTLNYWMPGLTDSERLRRRDELAKFFEEKKNRAAEENKNKNKFIYTRRSWHGQKVVRDLPLLTYYLKFNGTQNLFRIEDDISKQTSTATNIKFNPEFVIPGEKAPNTPANPNKEIPAFIELLDKGNYDLLSESDILMLVKFEGDLLKGTYSFRRSDPAADIWVIAKSEAPKI